MAYMLVPIGDHSSAPVPSLLPDDVNFVGHKSIGRADYRTNIKVVLKVFDCHMKWVPMGIKVCYDCLK